MGAALKYREHNLWRLNCTHAHERQRLTRSTSDGRLSLLLSPAPCPLSSPASPYHAHNPHGFGRMFGVKTRAEASSFPWNSQLRSEGSLRLLQLQLQLQLEPVPASWLIYVSDVFASENKRAHADRSETLSIKIESKRVASPDSSASSAAFINLCSLLSTNRAA